MKGTHDLYMNEGELICFVVVKNLLESNFLPANYGTKLSFNYL